MKYKKTKCTNCGRHSPLGYDRETDMMVQYCASCHETAVLTPRDNSRVSPPKPTPTSIIGKRGAGKSFQAQAMKARYAQARARHVEFEGDINEAIAFTEKQVAESKETTTKYQNPDGTITLFKFDENGTLIGSEKQK